VDLAVVVAELGLGPYQLSDLLYEEFFCQLEPALALVSHEEFVCQLEPALALVWAVGDPGQVAAVAAVVEVVVDYLFRLFHLLRHDNH
tara:strand:- start:26 stop:289 length:264 start_codon:yes stop_codon:yes gene_type:complete